MMRAFLFGLLALASPVMACDAETPCAVEGGDYLIAMPEAPAIGALVFLHGHGGSGAGTLSMRDMVEAATARGYAVVAPTGTPLGGNRTGNRWNFHPDFEHDRDRDDTAYLGAVIADAVTRFDLPRDRVIFGGFSAGGFMTSYLACAHPEMASAWVPVSGGFWRPDPASCAGPVRLFHTHGWADTTVPLEGRYLRSGTVAQGDIFHGMEIWRAANGCDQFAADRFEITDGFWRRSWDRCTPGSALEFALFPGSHMVPPGWADMVLEWYEGLPTP